MDNVNNVGNVGRANNLIRTNQNNLDKKNNVRKVQGLGKDEFFKLLVIQLSHQNPLEPMGNKEFIAQMAQFTALEQMIQMNRIMSRMNTRMNKTSSLNRAFFFLGKQVKVMDKLSGKIIMGKVQEIDLTNQENPGLKIKNRIYKLDQVIGIVTSGGNNLNTDKVNEVNENKK